MNEQEIKYEAILDPINKEGWRVMVNYKLTTPSFNSKGAAEAYIDLLKKGLRKPEFFRA